MMFIVCTVGTVIELKEAEKNVLKFQQSRDFKCDKHGYVNMPIGKVSKASPHTHPPWFYIPHTRLNCVGGHLVTTTCHVHAVENN